MEIVVPYDPNLKQCRFHVCGATEVVYGGAKGGGKSCALVMETLAYGLEYPGAEMYLFRETFDDLEANIILEWKSKVPKELYNYNESKHIATLFNGTRVFFRYVRNKADAAGYQGRSIDFIGIDELTKHEEEAVQDLLSCLRSPKGYPPRFRGTCNPGGIGHAWVKKRYIDPTHKGESNYTDPVTGNVIAFIPATVYDNTIIMQNDPAYVRRLENLPPMRKKAFLMGDWDAYEDQAFEEFSVDVHVCDDFKPPDHWRKWRSCDNGYDDPFAWYWFTVSETGQVFIYREYTREKFEPKVIYSDQARKVKELSTHLETADGELSPVLERVDFTVAGLDAWSTHHRDQTGKTLIDYYMEGGVNGFIPAITDRRLRKAVWHEYLRPYHDAVTDKWTAKLQICRSCKMLIETLPQLPKDEKDPEKVADCSIDHGYDSAGYGIIAYSVKQSKPLEANKSTIRKHKEELARCSINELRRRAMT